MTRLGVSQLLAVSLTLAGPVVPVQDSINDPEAYAVYASLLPQEWTIRHARARQLVIQRETASFNRCLPSGGAAETNWRSIVESYKAQNASVRHILPEKALGYPYVVVPREEILAFFKAAAPDPESGWSRFRERYPDARGYMEFSAVGFDTAKTRALVYIAHHCGSLCGGGQYYFLEKREGAWRHVTPEGVTMCLWRS